MNSKMKPRRFGVTRSLRGLPSQKVQEMELVEAECLPVFTWAEFNQAEATFLDEDTAVAVSAAVFNGGEYRFTTEALSKDVPKAQTGPKPTLATIDPKDWRAIAYMAVEGSYPMAVGFAVDVVGVKTDRHAIYHKMNRQSKADLKAARAAIGNEGKE